MRLAFLTHEPFHPPSGGGSAEAVYLVREMRRRNHDVTLFCPDFPARAEIERQHDIRVVPFTLWRMGRYTSLRTLKYLAFPGFLERQVGRAARTSSWDLLFTQHSIAAVAGGRLRRRLKIPLAMNLLDFLTGFMETWPHFLMPPLALRQLKSFESRLPARYQADAVLTVSDRLAERLARHGCPPDRLLPIYYGFDAEQFRLRESSPASERRDPVVMMHGSLDHHHLGPIATEAITYVAQRRPEVQFRIVGRHTPALTRFRNQVLGRNSQVRLECPGFIPYHQTGTALASADLGIVPYEESEGVHCAFVAKAVEYLATGLPVVSTSLDSLKRYFAGEPTLRFTPFEGRAFGQAILELLQAQGTQQRELAARLSVRVRQELAWDVVCARALDFVESRVDHGKSARVCRSI